MEIQKRTENGTTVLALVGRLDELATADAEAALLALVNEGELRAVVDMRGVEYVSSSGLRVLLMWAKATRRQGGEAVLFGVSPFVAEVLEVSNLTQVFTVRDSLEEARGVFES